MDTDEQAPPAKRGRWSLLTSPDDTPEVAAQRRRDTRRIWVVGLVLLAALGLVAGRGTPVADAADTPTARVTCNPACQLNRRLVAVCPSQPGSMTRARCIQWVQVAQCESGGQQTRVTITSLRQIGWRTNKYHDGGLQFTERTWRSNVGRIPARKLTRPQRRARDAGRYRYAYNAPPAVQILAAEVLRLRIGGNPQQSAGWPHCGAWWYS